MNRARATSFIRKAIAAAFPRGSAALDLHLDKVSQLGVDEIKELAESDDGMRRLAGPFQDLSLARVHMPKFSEIAEAVPGPITDAELERILSGGSRHEWGPWRRMAKKVMARRRPK